MTGSRIGVGVRCLLMSGVLLGQGHTPGGTPKLGNNPAKYLHKVRRENHHQRGWKLHAGRRSHDATGGRPGDG